MTLLQHSTWSLLPLELVDIVLEFLTQSYESDPAWQWMRLRPISGYLMRRIESYFWTFWLPKLNISVTEFGLCYDYYLDSTGPDANHDSSSPQAHFYCRTYEKANASTRLPATPEDISMCFSFEKKGMVVRLGEGEPRLNQGLRAGYIVNDVQVPELHLYDGALRLSCNWRQLLTNLMQEELMMRHIQNEMIKQWYMDTSKLSNQEWKDIIPILVSRVQYDRRTAVQKHRSLRFDPSGRTMSSFLQTPAMYPITAQRPQYLPRTPYDPEDDIGYYINNDEEKPPSLIDILRIEESMVYSLPCWKDLEFDTLCGLLADERGWKIFLRTRQNDHMTLEACQEGFQTIVRQSMQPHVSIAKFQRHNRWHVYWDD